MRLSKTANLPLIFAFLKAVASDELLQADASCPDGKSSSCTSSQGRGMLQVKSLREEADIEEESAQSPPLGCWGSIAMIKSLHAWTQLFCVDARVMKETLTACWIHDNSYSFVRNITPTTALIDAPYSLLLRPPRTVIVKIFAVRHALVLLEHLNENPTV